MSTVLIALWDGGGNSPPVLGLAGRLVARGHRVRVLADRSLAGAVAGAGAEHVAWTSAPQRASSDPSSEFVRDYEARTPVGEVRRLQDRLMIGPAAAFLADTEAEIAASKPDVVLVENLLVGAQLAAEAAGLPYASIVPNIFPGPVPGRPPFGPGLLPRDDLLGRMRDRAAGAVGRRLWDRRLDEFNDLRRSRGAAPLASLFDGLVLPDRVLVLTSAAFEFGGQGTPPPNVVYCGPSLEDPDWSGSWEPPPGDAPLVLASLSTTMQNQDRVLPRIIAALGELPVRGVVTTGPSAPAPDPRQVPDNVTVVPAAPHSAVLRHASLAISHGGHGTVMKSLAAGVPVLCLPVSRDQPDTAARVVAAGAGLRLRPTAGRRAITRAVAELLTEQSYRSAAARLASVIAADRERDVALAEVERLLAR